MLDYSYEQQKISEGYSVIAGVDEVGRGPWAGPVVAAACILDYSKLPSEVRDSKKLSAKKREALAPLIEEHMQVALGEASAEEIDEHNILQATFMAMSRAVDNLPQKPDFLFIDGNKIPPQIDIPAETVVKGDDKVASIACASIVAKVYRDKLMAELAATYPQYAWEKNAGYGTKAHQEGLAEFGVTEHHRKSFKPIAALLA